MKKPTMTVDEAAALLSDEMAVPGSEIKRLLDLLDGPDYEKAIKHVSDAIEALGQDMQMTCLFLAVFVLHSERRAKREEKSSSAGESS